MMSSLRGLDEGSSTADDDTYDEYYSAPRDEVKPEGKTILLLVIFAILVSISVGYYILTLLFPNVREMIEGKDEDEDDAVEPSKSYQPPRSSAGEIALV